MDVNKPISGEFAALIPMLGNTMKFATQALAESSVLAELLVEKGVVTKAELDKRALNDNLENYAYYAAF